jgi:hypothetical protein
MKRESITDDERRATLAEIKAIRQELSNISREFFCQRNRVRPAVEGAFTELGKLDLNLSLSGHFIALEMFTATESTEPIEPPELPHNGKPLSADEHRRLGWRLYAVRMAIHRLFFDVFQPCYPKSSTPCQKMFAAVKRIDRIRWKMEAVMLRVDPSNASESYCCGSDFNIKLPWREAIRLGRDAVASMA